VSIPPFSAGTPALVNTTTDGYQSLNNLFVTTDGGWEVAWSTVVGTPGNVSYQWFAQRYDGWGNKLGGETALAAAPDAPVVSASQHEVALSDGTTVRLNGAPFGAFSAQLYDSAGIAVGDPLLVNGAARGWSYAATALPDGNVALVFQPINGTGPGEIFTALLDRTSPGTTTWEVSAMYHAGFGILPGAQTLDLWTAQAAHASNAASLAQQMIDFYAPGVSTAALVTDVYMQLVHAAPSAQTVQAHVDQVGPGHAYATQGELLAYAAHLSLNTDALVGLVGSAQAMDAWPA
jgi:hypothetical protein